MRHRYLDRVALRLKVLVNLLPRYGPEAFGYCRSMYNQRRKTVASKSPAALLRRTFNGCKQNAKRRGIPFELTFLEWLGIWVHSGRLAERGKGTEQYQMARYGDKGPYAVGNVKIITSWENHHEMAGRPKSIKARANMSSAQRGNKNSLGHRNGLGNKSHTGLTQSAEIRKKISRSLRAYYEGRKT